ncbi:terminase small subunit [Zoogloea sp.]|uniref:terminase small subunit n=1 Tax=Zoogloea sp. TaxID=49181 RepID=UPI0014166424|nr:MAG: terminase small subunit [Zoogloea sp.]
MRTFKSVLLYCVNGIKTERKKMGTIVDRNQLVEEMQIGHSTLTKYISQGLPYVDRGGSGRLATFDLEACKQWRQERYGKTADDDESMQQARLRKLQAEASLAELELQKSHGQVIPIEDVAEELADLFSKIKSQLLALPVITAGLVYGKETVREIQAIIDEQIRIVLIELSSKYIKEEEQEDELTRDIKQELPQ